MQLAISFSFLHAIFKTVLLDIFRVLEYRLLLKTSVTQGDCINIQQSPSDSSRAGIMKIKVPFLGGYVPPLAWGRLLILSASDSNPLFSGADCAGLNGPAARLGIGPQTTLRC